MINLFKASPLRRAPLPTPEVHVLRIGADSFPLRFRRNAQAKRMILRLDRKLGLVMTLPNRTTLAEALGFAEKSSAWILKVVQKKQAPVVLGDGSEVMFRGELNVLRLRGGTRGVVTFGQGEIDIPGNPEHSMRRLADALKAQALAEVQACSRTYAAAMATKFSRITIRDQKSRWGSCSSSGALSYSWRLILTPPYVLDYVCAHEVAHLLEMNHGPKFWRLVLKHCPNARVAKEWLKRHGSEVHRYFQ